MPYCWKCGTKLEEDAKFCPNCGAAVAQLPKIKDKRWKKMSLITAILVALILITGILCIITFLPVQAINLKESREVAYQSDVNMLDLDFSANIANVNLSFEELGDKLVVLNVSVTGKASIIASMKPLNLIFQYNLTNHVLEVTSEAVTLNYGLPWFYQLYVKCDIYIDPSLNTSLNIKTDVGEIIVNAKAEVDFDSLKLETTTGAITLDLAESISLAGNISIKTTTGKVELSWKNLIVRKKGLVDVKTTTGGIALNIMQRNKLFGNVTLKAEATTGGIDFIINIYGNVGAKIESNTTIGAINIRRKYGFSGIPSILRSENYPAQNNFDVNLKTTTGGIDINAGYKPEKTSETISFNA
jgi:predicted nucleic acid-binding Zn ribbon protein